jgi:hypothetical protein
MIPFLIAALASFIGSLILIPVLLGLLRMFGIYTTVQEGSCHVYVLFGKVAAIIDEPGIESADCPLAGPPLRAGYAH